MSIGARLAELRLKKGKSLQEVADAVGVSKTHVWQMEKGRSENPSSELLKKLSDYFGVTLEYLAGTSGAVSLVDAEAQQFFRDFKSLSETERQILMQTLEVFKNKKSTGDGNS
ncbi:MAG: helix-turn-helix transcriptional regulator [Burkholderiaceae bacterium]